MKETDVTAVEAVNTIATGKTGTKREIKRGTVIKREAEIKRRRKGVERTRLARHLLNHNLWAKSRGNVMFSANSISIAFVGQGS